jgi:hypothetical protein
MDMSLEVALAGNTAAIRDLIEVWSKLSAQTARIGTSFSGADQPAVVEPPAAPTPVAEPEAPAAIDYNTVSLAITEAVKADRAKVVATLAAFGVAKGTELTADQYAAFMQALAA